MISLTQLFTGKKTPRTKQSLVPADSKPVEVKKPAEEVKPPVAKTIRDLKKFLKGIAAEIKTKRPLFRNEQRTKVVPTVGIYELIKLSWEFRLHHIAYCEMRGRTRDKIEKPRQDNLPDEKRIKEIKDEYGAQTLHLGT